MIRVVITQEDDDIGTKKLGEMIIRNIGGTQCYKDYKFKIFKSRSGAVWKEGHSYNFSIRKKTIWDLVFNILNKAVGDRNRDGKCK